MIVRTISGAEYKFANGRMTRTADVNPYCPPDQQPVERIVNEPFELIASPVPGEQMTFRILKSRRIYDTSLIREVEYPNGLIFTGAL